MLAVPTNQLTLCAALQQLETITWAELEAGYRCKQKLDEESITSYHLMRLATAVPAIVLEKHHRGRESRSGADWEWWVGGPGAYVGFRVQAKILNASSVEYGSLYHSRDKAVVQVEKLINAAAAATRPTYPLYAFYNYWLSGTGRVPLWPCPRPTGGEPHSIGWTVASAHEVREHLMGWPSKKLWDMSKIMFPVSCVFCCGCARGLPPLAGRRRLAEEVAARITARWSENSAPVVMEQAPVYIERMYKKQQAEDGWSWLPTQLRPSERRIPPGLSRVLLVRDLAPAA